MDFYPPRAERPGRGIAVSLLAVPIGVIGYWLASWSIVATGVFMVFLGLLQVLLYRSGSRSRVIVTGRRRLLVVGGITMVLAAVGGTLVSVVRILGSAGLTDLGSLLSVGSVLASEPTDVGLAALVGVAAGVFSLVYFVRRFSRPQPVGA